MQYLYSFAVALFVTLALVPLLASLADKLSLVDAPTSERKVHEVVMPRIGGLAIVLGILLPLIFFLELDQAARYYIAACGIIVLFGLLDDRIELNFKWKLFGQVLASILVIWGGGAIIHDLPFFGDSLAPAWFDYLFTLLFLVGVVNGVNFSDGMDGLAAGTSIMALLVIFLLAIQSENEVAALVSLTVVGGILGFLRYNTFPAKVFMGDTGSQFLGFVIALLAILVTQAESAPFSALLPFLILGIPILDICQVIPVRVKKKLPLPGPDKEHFHHQIWKLGFRHYEVVAIIYLLQAILLVSAFKLRFEPDLVVAGFYFSFGVLVLGSIFVCQYFDWQFRREFRRGDGFERRNKLLRRMPWFYHNSSRVVAVLLCGFFLILGWQLKEPAMPFFVFSMAILFLSLGLLIFDRRGLRLFFRFVLYGGSVFFAYLIVMVDSSLDIIRWVTVFLFCLLAVLVLAFRMSRKEDFSLNNQDLLILLVIVLTPLLPFGQMDQYSISEIVLISAILLYACEFLLSRGKKTIAVTVGGQLIGLSILCIYGILHF